MDAAAVGLLTVLAGVGLDFWTLYELTLRNLLSIKTNIFTTNNNTFKINIYTFALKTQCDNTLLKTIFDDYF